MQLFPLEEFQACLPKQHKTLKDAPEHSFDLKVGSHQKDIQIPVQEAYETVELFLPSLRKDTAELIVTMIQTQLALGHLGVAFIRSAQLRKNLLLTVDRAHEKPTSAKDFAQTAFRFMALVTIPYMLERTLMENVGNYAFAIFANKVESNLRIHSLFPTMESNRLCLLSAVASSNSTVGTYADQTLGRIWKT